MGQAAHDGARVRETDDATGSRRAAAEEAGLEAASADRVLCLMTGAWIPRAEAVMVTLGPGRRRWVRRDLTNAGR
jgi:hypothetical protein